jgi:hypothetical protein
MERAGMTRTHRISGLAAVVGLVVGVALPVACDSSGGGLADSCTALSLCCPGSSNAAVCNDVVEADEPATCTQVQTTFCGVDTQGSGTSGGTSDCVALAVCCIHLPTSQQSTCTSVVSAGQNGACAAQVQTYRSLGMCQSSVGDDSGVGDDGDTMGSGPGQDDSGSGGAGDDGGEPSGDGGEFSDDGGSEVDTGSGGGSCVAPGGECSDKDDCCDALTSCTNGTCACGTAGYDCTDISCCPGFDCVSVDNGTDMECQAQGCQQVGEACTSVDDCCADAFLCSESPDGGAGNVCWATQ